MGSMEPIKPMLTEPQHSLGGEHDMNIQEMQIAKPLFKSNAHRGCITGAGKVEFVG